MRSPIRTALAVTLALGLAAPGTAAAANARASGGDTITLTYPSIVKTRVARAQRALDRATARIENGQRAAATRPLKTVRRQLAAAWRGARYKIRTQPPPVADEARARTSGCPLHAEAYSSGDGPTGPTVAAPADTAFLVLTLQHDVAVAMVQLIDGLPDANLAPLATTLAYAVDGRDKAIADIVRLAPPTPADEEGAEEARAAGDGGAAASTFATVMPEVTQQVDDEIDAIRGTVEDATDLTARGRAVIEAAATKVARTKALVSRTWPPVPAED